MNTLQKNINVHLTATSGNKKTGPIPVTTSSKNTCPDSCPLKSNGCYGENYHLNRHWQKVTDGTRGYSLDQLCDQIRYFPVDQLWRDNQAGDQIPEQKNKDNMCMLALAKKVKANKRKRGFTFTHYQLNNHNLECIKFANKNGFTVNASANNNADLDRIKLRSATIPTVVVLPANHTAKVSYTPAGHKIVVCPAANNDKMNCARCGLCAVSERSYTIGFPVHGTAKKRAAIACNLTGGE